MFKTKTLSTIKDNIDSPDLEKEIELTDLKNLMFPQNFKQIPLN
jgi:hypothetical protein